MISAAQIIRMLFDPRGRADRIEMLVAAGVVLGLEVVSALFVGAEGLLAFVMKTLAIWIGVAVTAKRLRDMGFSAWWLAGGAAVLCIWTAFLAFGFLIFVGPAELGQGSFGMLAFLGLLMMPTIGAALWLHLAEGEQPEEAQITAEQHPSSELTSAAV